MNLITFAEGKTFKCKKNHLTTINAMNTELGVNCHECLHPIGGENSVTYHLKMSDVVIEEVIL